MPYAKIQILLSSDLVLTFCVIASAIPIEPFTGSAYAFILIKQWLECCTTKHSSCKSALADDLDHPTRLLAVDKGQFKLVETTDLEKTPAYLTLSHCWGSIEILKLTRENIQDFRYGIPEDQLCKTFADAIYITRTLGFQYLWIDSLCIIQNDVEDWRKEASKMSSVYGGSSLNLAASAASDGREGCFFSRNDADMQRMAHQQIQWTKNSQRWTFNCIDPTLYTSCMQDCPLNQRGWTFQERFLSPKTLHFTKLQLYWECRESMACEMYQEALPNFVQNGSFGFLERRDAKKAWARAVEQYSARKLTFEKDRLPAIAGVARWVHNQTGDEYVAGLWRINLEEQLLWNTYESLPSQPHRGNAPSWSWASYDQRIDLFTADEEQTKLMFCRVVDIELKFKGHDPYGETASGRLELRTGPLIGVTFVNAAPEYLNRRRSIMGFAFDTKGQHNTVGSWYFLPICKIGDELGEQTIEGLILQAIPGTGDGQFRRVGTFMERFVSKFPIATAMEDPKCWADRSVYKGDAGVDDSGKLQYFITLV